MRLRYTPRAQADLDIIYGFIDRRNPEAARAVKEIIEHRIAWLADFPLIAPETSKHGVRELTIVRFPYKVYYAVRGDELWIIHIRHTARRPWRGADE
jgi:addiction module RelE/StbE family toxin